MSGNFHVFELLAGCVGVIGALLVIASFALLPKYREHPAALILLVSICDLFLSLKFLVRGAAWLAPSPNYEDAHSFHIFNDNCTSSIAWSAVFETASMSWNAIWCFHLVYQTRYPDRDAAMLFKFYHAYVWLVVVANLVVQLTASDYGTANSSNGYHYCSLLPHTIHNKAVLFDFVLSVISIATALGSLIYTGVRLGCGVSREVHALALRHYAFCFIFIFLWAAEKAFVLTNVSSNFHTAVAILWQAQGFFVAAVRLSEPGLLRALLRRLRCTACMTEAVAGSAEDDALSRHLLLATWGDFSGDEDDRPSQGAWGASANVRAELSVTDSLGPVNSGGSRSNTGPRRLPPSKPRGVNTPRKQYFGDL